MEGYCSTGQSPQWAVVPVEEEEVGQLCVLDCHVLMILNLIVVLSHSY
jgi:hypothetical protein